MTCQAVLRRDGSLMKKRKKPKSKDLGVLNWETTPPVAAKRIPHTSSSVPSCFITGHYTAVSVEMQLY